MLPTFKINLTQLAFPIVLTPGEPMTDEDFRRFSALNPDLRMERNGEGKITILTPLTGSGGINEAYVSRIFGDWSLQDGRGIHFSANAGFKLKDGSTLSPDVAWLPLERWNALTPAEQEGFVPFCPEFLIEIRSQTDGRSALEKKMLPWMANDVQLAWLVDPIDATVTIYRAGHATQTLERPDNIHGDAPVAGFELACTRLWPPR